MKSKTITYILFTIITVVFIITVIILFSNFNKSKETNQVIFKDYKLKIENNKELINYLRKKDSFQFLSEGLNFYSKNFIFSDYNNKSILFKSLFNDKDSILILRISDKYCLSCYDSFFEILKDKVSSSNKGIKKIIALCNFDSGREMRILQEKFNLNNIGFYSIDKDMLFKIENFNSPYLFVITKNGYCSNFYAIDKGNIEASEKYLDFILKSLK